MLIAVAGPLEETRDAPVIESESQLDAWKRVVRIDEGGR